MSDLFGNPEDRVSHIMAYMIHVYVVERKDQGIYSTQYAKYSTHQTIKEWVYLVTVGLTFECAVKGL